VISVAMDQFVAHTSIKVLFEAALAAAIFGTVPAHADPRAGDGPPRGDLRHAHHFQREGHDEPGRLPADPQRIEPQRSGDDRFDEEQRRALRRDLDRANREIYQK